MSKHATNHVKAPVPPKMEPDHMMEKGVNDQFHGENTKSLQDDKKISNQGNGAGRPPMMKK